MNAIEGKGRHIISIAHEVLERQLNGDHFALLGKAALIVALRAMLVNPYHDSRFESSAPALVRLTTDAVAINISTWGTNV